MPEMMRLRRGKWRACGSVPSGNSARIAPSPRERLVQPAILLGIDDVDAAGDDRDRAGLEALRDAPRRRCRAQGRRRRRSRPRPARRRDRGRSGGRWPRRCARRPPQSSGRSARERFARGRVRSAPAAHPRPRRARSDRAARPSRRGAAPRRSIAANSRRGVAAARSRAAGAPAALARGSASSAASAEPKRRNSA